MPTREELERRSDEARRRREAAAEDARARDTTSGGSDRDALYRGGTGSRSSTSRRVGLQYADSGSAWEPGQAGAGFRRGVAQLVDAELERESNDRWRNEYLDADPTFTPEYTYEDTVDAGGSAFDGAAAGSIEAQRRALGLMQQQAETQGFTPAENAMRASAMRQAEQTARGQRMADLQALEARGMAGSGVSMVSGQMAAQAGADRAADFDAQAMMAAQQRALAAMQQYGQQASAMRGQDYQAAGALDQWNNAIAERAQGVQARNAERYNQAQDQGIANRFSREQLRQNQYGQTSQLAENERDRAYGERTGREAQRSAIIGGAIGSIGGVVRGLGG
jgi:hypothetical protein